MPGKQAGWIGLGLIGLPMAARLAAAGWQVRGFDISRLRLDLAVARGIEAAASAEAAMEGASLVFSSMPTDAALIELAAKLAAGLPKTAILVETTTAGPAASVTVAETLAARGIRYLRSPISGSVNLAESGGLTTFVSGPRAAFDAARPALAAYSRAQIWLGEGEEARYAKLAVNLMVAVTAGMMKEALALGTQGGISWEKMLELIGESVVASPVVKYKLDPVRRHDYTPTATTSLVLKDVDLMIGAAKLESLELPLAAEMQKLLRRAVAEGLAERDFFSVVEGRN